MVFFSFQPFFVFSSFYLEAHLMAFIAFCLFKDMHTLLSAPLPPSSLPSLSTSFFLFFYPSLCPPCLQHPLTPFSPLPLLLSSFHFLPFSLRPLPPSLPPFLLFFLNPYLSPYLASSILPSYFPACVLSFLLSFSLPPFLPSFLPSRFPSSTPTSLPTLLPLSFPPPCLRPFLPTFLLPLFSLPPFLPSRFPSCTPTSLPPFCPLSLHPSIPSLLTFFTLLSFYLPPFLLTFSTPHLPSFLLSCPFLHPSVHHVYTFLLSIRLSS